MKVGGLQKMGWSAKLEHEVSETYSHISGNPLEVKEISVQDFQDGFPNWITQIRGNKQMKLIESSIQEWESSPVLQLWTKITQWWRDMWTGHILLGTYSAGPTARQMMMVSEISCYLQVPWH
jgi:hypothetical protein